MTKEIDAYLDTYKLSSTDYSVLGSIENEKLVYFYKSSYSGVKYRNKPLESYFKVMIDDNNAYELCQRYINFIYIAGNKEPFGKFEGFFRKENKCHLIYEFDPERTLHKLLKEDPEGILDDTTKSKTVFAVAAVLEYCHALGIGCRFIHPQSIFYNKKKNPFIANIGYSNSILNAPNSTFDRSVINSTKPIFENINDYVCPELTENLNAYTFSADIYAFGILLEKIGENGRNEVITNIIQNCRNHRANSSEILKTLVDLGDTPLFEYCEMKEYKEYQKRVLNNLYLTTKLKPYGDDRISLFVNASRLFNQNEVLDPEVKKNILNMLLSAVAPDDKNKRFIPAVYMLANFLESNNDTFIYDITKTDIKCYDSMFWMNKAVKIGVFEAPLKLAEIYNRRGLFNQSKKVYESSANGNCLCYLMMNYNQESEFKKVKNKPLFRSIPEFFLQINIYEELNKLTKNINEDSITNFETKMKELCKTDINKNGPKYITGKPLYFISVLYRDGMISDKVVKGIDGIVPSPAIKPDKVDLSKYKKYKNEDKRISYLKESAKLLYEPAVAEYVDYLLDKEKIDEARNIINAFFSKEHCRDDCSRSKIRHAYAKLCEKQGDKEMALRIYKESADRGYIKSHDDYLRLYNDEKIKNPIIIKYYENRRKRFEETK